MYSRVSGTAPIDDGSRVAAASIHSHRCDGYGPTMAGDGHGGTAEPVGGAVTTRPCPACGAPLDSATTFPSWCPHCDWNLVSGTVALDVERQVRKYARFERRAEDMLQSAAGAAAETEKPRSSGWVFAIAAFVHLLTLLVAMTGVVTVVVWPTVLGGIAAAALAGLAFVVRPRFGTMPVGIKLEPEAFPHLAELVHRICTATGAPPFDAVFVSTETNASTSTVGWRRARVLVIGYPLWNMLEPDERIALLAHEVAHGVNGDTRRSFVVASALRTLLAWRRAMWSNWTLQLAGPVAVVVVAIRVLVKAPLRALAGVLYAAEIRLTLRANRHGEYLADVVAVELAGRQPVLRLLDKTYLGAITEDYLTRLAMWQPNLDLWLAQREFLGRLPPTEWERLRRLDRRTPELPSSTHPKTHRRLSFVERLAGPASTAPIIDLTDQDAAALGAELRPVAAAVQRALRTARPPSRVHTSSNRRGMYSRLSG